MSEWRSWQAWMFLAPRTAAAGGVHLLADAVGQLPRIHRIQDHHAADVGRPGELRRAVEDPFFLISIKNSLLYLLIVPVIQLGAICSRCWSTTAWQGSVCFRAAFYMPVVTSVSVVGIMWGWMYNEQGFINGVLQWLRVINERSAG